MPKDRKASERKQRADRKRLLFLFTVDFSHTHNDFPRLILPRSSHPSPLDGRPSRSQSQSALLPSTHLHIIYCFFLTGDLVNDPNPWETHTSTWFMTWGDGSTPGNPAVASNTPALGSGSGDGGWGEGGWGEGGWGDNLAVDVGASAIPEAAASAGRPSIGVGSNVGPGTVPST